MTDTLQDAPSVNAAFVLNRNAQEDALSQLWSDLEDRLQQNSPAVQASSSSPQSPTKTQPSCTSAESLRSIDAAVARADGDCIRLTLAMGATVESFTLRRSSAVHLVKALAEALE